MFGTRLPKRVSVGPSCHGLAAAFNPQVQNAALNLLGRSLDPSNPAGRAEWARMISQPLWGTTPWMGAPFTDYNTNEISGDRIARARPSAMENLLTGYQPRSVFLHTHPNPEDPGGISRADRELARQGIPVIAIDTKGRLTCAF